MPMSQISNSKSLKYGPETFGYPKFIKPSKVTTVNPFSNSNISDLSVTSLFSRAQCVGGLKAPPDIWPVLGPNKA